ncbi:hypothetical protein [Helicobacter labetoulli]|uniref:hypothetical protein n=1 Tax=Helicobacter labetoulli TaxID=2315333 RepID=UPI0013007D5D|nr:hypothetical protein [Helicobacter labetoulli]
MKSTKTALFFSAWHSDLKKSGVKTKNLGEITLSIREKQTIAYNQIRTISLLESLL